jgi:hypothetical protein
VGSLRRSQFLRLLMNRKTTTSDDNGNLPRLTPKMEGILEGVYALRGAPWHPVWFVFRSLSSHRIALNARCARHGSDVACRALRSTDSVLCDVARC